MRILLCLSLTALSLYTGAQVAVTDEPNVGQAWRMVAFKWNSWKPGNFLGKFYWDTFHSSYRHGKDRRPLGPGGPYTKAMILIETQENEESKYQKYTAEIRKKHVSEDLNNQGGTADLPWNLYYGDIFWEHMDKRDKMLTSMLSNGTRVAVQWLIQTKLLQAYNKQRDLLIDRINALHNAYMPRGSRILAYQRLDNEFTSLNSSLHEMLDAAVKFKKIPFQDAQGAKPFLTELNRQEKKTNESAAQFVWRVYKF